MAGHAAAKQIYKEKKCHHQRVSLPLHLLILRIFLIYIHSLSDRVERAQTLTLASPVEKKKNNEKNIDTQLCESDELFLRRESVSEIISLLSFAFPFALSLSKIS